MANVIDSLTLGSSTGIFSIPFTTCSTPAATANKILTLTNFALEVSAQVRIKFTYANTAANPTLNINDTGDKAIYWQGDAIAPNQYWLAGSVLDFVYNGTQWDLVGIANDNDTLKKVELTKAEYEALTTKDPNTIYILTDEGVIINDIEDDIEELKATKASRYTATATLTTDGWSSSAPYTQTVSVSGILTTDTPHIVPIYSSDLATAKLEQIAWNCIDDGDTDAGTITFKCFTKKPVTALNISIETIR